MKGGIESAGPISLKGEVMNNLTQPTAFVKYKKRTLGAVVLLDKKGLVDILTNLSIDEDDEAKTILEEKGGDDG